MLSKDVYVVLQKAVIAAHSARVFADALFRGASIPLAEQERFWEHIATYGVPLEEWFWDDDVEIRRIESAISLYLSSAELLKRMLAHYSRELSTLRTEDLLSSIDTSLKNLREK